MTMIQYAVGNILGCDADVLVNPVNCVGVMGRRLALEFKNAFPDNFRAYAAACRRGDVAPGSMFVHETGRLTAPRCIVNFPTKCHWRSKSRMEDIDSGLGDLIRTITARDIRSIAIPPLGAGLGGLDWGDVRARIESAVSLLAGNIRVIVFEPPPTTTRSVTPSGGPGAPLSDSSQPVGSRPRDPLR